MTIAMGAAQQLQLTPLMPLLVPNPQVGNRKGSRTYKILYLIKSM
jgi:hypothetical protein